MSQEITQKVIEVISEQLEIEVDNIKAESAFQDDLKADSLAVVELVLALEEAFGIEIPDEDTEKIRTVQDAITSRPKFVSPLASPSSLRTRFPIVVFVVEKLLDRVDVNEVVERSRR